MSKKRDREAEGLLCTDPAFGGLGSRALGRVLSMMHERKYDPGQDIYAQGTYGAGMYMVLTGSVELIAEGAEPSIVELRPGEVFGAEALLGESPVPRPRTARAKGHCRVLVLLLPEILALELAEPALAGKIREAVAGHAQS